MILIKERPLWSVGFRPFFLSAILMGIGLPLLWVAHYTGIRSLPVTPFTPNEWHAHEMIFGFAFAVICGFLLTASSHWTKIKAMQGRSLACFFFYFIFIRILFLWQPFADKWIYILLDAINQLVLIGWLIFLAVKAKHPRVLMMGLIIGALLATNLAYLSGNSSAASEVAINLLQLLFVVITGLLVPFFHSSAIQPLRLKEDPFLRALLIASMAFIVFQPFLRGSELGERCLLIAFILGASLTVYRLYIWNMFRALQKGILFILYAGYSWIGVRLVLEALQLSGVIADTTRLALHAFTFGTMGTVIIGMIIRVSKGHTGRKIDLGALGLLAYCGIIAATQVRVFGPLFLPQETILWIRLSGALWMLAFICTGLETIPKLIGPRVDAKPQVTNS